MHIGPTLTRLQSVLTIPLVLFRRVRKIAKDDY